MARIRTIKPAFFRHSDLFQAERETGLPLRVAFAGLWTAADREGRFAWRPLELKLDCLPHDDVDFSRVLDALTTRGFLVRYASEDGRVFGAIPSWHKHQVINNREGASEIPAPTNDDLSITSTRAPRVPNACPTPLVHALGEGKGREGNGREGEGAAPPPSSPTPRGPGAFVSSLDFEKLRLHNAYVGARLRVPKKLHGDFVAQLGGADADTRLRGWYAQVDEEIERTGEPIAPDVWKWLEARFKAFVTAAAPRPTSHDIYEPASAWQARHDAEVAKAMADAPDDPVQVFRDAMRANRERKRAEA